MNEEFVSLPPAVAEALTARGFESLTPVQQAVLAPEAHDRELRISSQTGSGKTVALGLVLIRELLAREEGKSGPSALVLAPTRELASQVCKELTWLLRPLGMSLCVVTGGTAFGPEARELRRRPDVVIATPGRLRDHLERKSLDPSGIRTVVLDEADQMLDFGFREELEKILGFLPEERRAHLVSATFASAVLQLAERYQRNPYLVKGSAVGVANQDIEHVVHVVPHTFRFAALTNVLLLDPQERTLVFCRTRADTAEVAELLQQAGFAAAAMSGELAQAERTRRLDAFRSGNVPILVATDVAARGIDVPDVSRVVHLHLTSDTDAYTHRSGRTGRAGRGGHSIILTTPRDERLVQRLLGQLRIKANVCPVPGPEEVQKASDERIHAQLKEGEAPGERATALAAQLLEGHDPQVLVARLLQESTLGGPCRAEAIPEVRSRVSGGAPQGDRPSARQPLGPVKVLQLDWGARDGADARRLVAMVCRRTGLSSSQIGAIQVGPHSSMLEVSRDHAQKALNKLQEPDAQDRPVRVRISPTPLQRRAPARPGGRRGPPPGRPARSQHAGG